MEKESESLAIFDTGRKVNGNYQYNVLLKETNQIICCIYFSIRKKRFVSCSLCLAEVEVTGEDLLFIGRFILSLSPIEEERDGKKD